MNRSTVVIFLLLSSVARAEQNPPSDQALEEWRKVGLQAEEHLISAHYSLAAESANQALRLAKRFGPSDSRLGSTHYLLGVTYREWGHCPDARTHYLSAISIWRKQPEPKPRLIARAASGLVSVLSECGDFTAAEKAFKTYEADLQRGAVEPGDRSQLLSLRAILSSGRQDYKLSASFFREALDILDRTPGSSVVEAMILRNSLSASLNRLGHYHEALTESTRSADFFAERKPLHPAYIAALNNEACALASLRRREESERTFERALAAARELYGEDNHITARIMLSYARVLRENHESSAAATWRKRGEETYHRSLLRSTQTVDIRELQR